MTVLTVDNNELSPVWKAADASDGARAKVNTSNDFEIRNLKAGKTIALVVTTTASEQPQLLIREDPAQANRAQVDLSVASQGSKFTIGGAIELHAEGASGGETKLVLQGPIRESTAIGARVYHNADQSTSSGVNLTLGFNSERFDTDGIHSTTTNNSRLTCKTAGVYLIWM